MSSAQTEPLSKTVVMRIVSGGQTGVDRAALDVALALGMPCGGWCPKGRLAEDGTLPARYPLLETLSEDYVQRTTWNVRDADATLILNRGPMLGGTAQTLDDAVRLGKPCLVLQVEETPRAEDVRAWIVAHHIQVLNVAGPRESKCPGIYREASALLRRLLTASNDRTEGA